VGEDDPGSSSRTIRQVFKRSPAESDTYGVTTAETVPPTWSTAPPAEVAAAAGADDLFVLRRLGGGRLVQLGGTGSGAASAEIVELLVETTAEAVERRLSTEPINVFGRYYARAAAVVRVGDDLVVVFGGAKPMAASDAELVELARFVVGRTPAA
jgi:hypothetical protein